MRQTDHWDAVTVIAIRDLTPGIRELTLHTPWMGAHTPGAHIDVEVPVGGGTAIRSYSLVGEAAGAVRRIAVKLEANSRGGSRHMWSLAPGAGLRARPPANSFELSLQDVPTLLLAGGIGVTPMLAMAAALVRRGAPVSMIYAGRSRPEMAYRDDLAALLGPRLTLAVDDEGGGPPDLAAAFADLAPEAEAYVCGPVPMLEAARRAWAAAGRPAARLRFESFGSGGRLANAPFRVLLPRLGLEIKVPENRSMLEALGEAGVQVMADCRRGECGLCALTVLGAEGEIDHRDVFLSDAQHAAGTRICACVSRVAGGSITVEPAWRGDISVTPSKVFG